MDDFTIERRKSQRLETVEEIDFSDGVGFFTERCYDISSHGIKIESSRPIKEGTSLVITLPAKPPFKIKGEVKWKKRAGLKYIMGVEFFFDEANQERRLREVVQSLFWQSYKA